MPTTKITDSATLPLTIEWIKKLIKEGSESIWVKQMIESTEGNPNALQSVFNWIWENVQYAPDPVDQQNLKTVERTFKDCRSNCANYCILLGSYLYAIGRPFSLRVASYSSDKVPEHIYIESQGIPLDLTAGQDYKDKTLTRTAPKYAYEFPNATFIKDYPMANASVMQYTGRSNYFRKWYS